MARQKVAAAPILESFDQVDQAIREWYALDAEVEKIAVAQQDQINKIKSRFVGQAKDAIARKMRLEKDVQDFCEYYSDMFAKEKSKKLTFGTVGFRKSTRLVYLRGWDAKRVLAKLKELGRFEFIKKTESVKRDEIKKAELDAEAMRLFGCTIKHEDKFWFEPDKAAIANAKEKLKLVRKSA